MPMEVISTYGRIHFALVSHLHRQHLPTLRKWDVHRNSWRVQPSRRALPLGVAARSSLRGEQSIQKRSKVLFIQKIASINRPAYFSLFTSTEITRSKKGATYLESKRPYESCLSLLCKSLAVIQDNYLSALRRAASVCVAMLICTCSHGDARDTHST